LLRKYGVVAAYHYAPLHYLPFIARTGALLSKADLRKLGFKDSHFRSTSRKQDEERGFARYVHLTLDAHPPILRAKLAGGFPHFEVAIPAVEFDNFDYLLCRFNIAKTRYFRGARQEPPESEKNGRYYPGLRLPVAVSSRERQALLSRCYGHDMIELLVMDRIALCKGTTFRFFDKADLAFAQEVLKTLDVGAYDIEQDAALSYEPLPQYRAAVQAALKRALSDKTWLGDGLEFDRV
jgi:hypothetical protein